MKYFWRLWSLYLYLSVPLYALIEWNNRFLNAPYFGKYVSEDDGFHDLGDYFRAEIEFVGRQRRAYLEKKDL